MAFFYRMDVVLDTLSAPDDKARPLTWLCPVERHLMPGGFVLDVKPIVLDFDTEASFSQLATLLEQVPLYRFNMELALDAALITAQNNETVRLALTEALLPDTLPSTVQPEQESPESTGSLRYPMLEHLDRPALAKFYIRLLRNLKDASPAYTFEQAILGQHVEQFTALFDGFMLGNAGQVKASLLLNHARRPDHAALLPLEDHISAGQRKAAGMDVAAGREALWAWLEADQDQLRRCRDIDRLKNLLPTLRTPDWVREDVFALLKKEAMKQHFADILLPDLALVERAPHIAQAVLANAQGHVDDSLRQLLAQTLNVDVSYSGAAGRFADLAQARQMEFRNLKI